MFEYLTQQEVYSQPEALKKTLDYLLENREKITGFFRSHKGRRIVVMGCGSSAMLARSARMIFEKSGEPVSSITGGEYLVKPESYAHLIKDSIVVILSRSGMTTEILRAARTMSENSNAVFLSVTMKEENDLLPVCQLNLLMPWAYDHSVCQTRTVSNLYLTILLLQAFRSEDSKLEEAAIQAVEDSSVFLNENRALLENVAKRDFDRAVVLSDGPMGGIGEEAALAFTEISMLPGAHFGVLDYRHGPIVLHGPKTLTLVLLRPADNSYQQDMLEDLSKTGCILVTVGGEGENSQLNLPVKTVKDDCALGLYLIWTAQVLALAKALECGKNPDQPAGLDAYIALK